MIQVLRHIKNFSRSLSKAKIRDSFDHQKSKYPELAKKDNFKISALLNNTFNHLNKNESEEALECIKLIRKNLSKQKTQKIKIPKIVKKLKISTSRRLLRQQPATGRPGVHAGAD